MWLTPKVFFLFETHLLQKDDIFDDARVDRDEYVGIGVGCKHVLHLWISLILIIKARDHERSKQCLKYRVKNRCIESQIVSFIKRLLKELIGDVAIG